MTVAAQSGLWSFAPQPRSFENEDTTINSTVMDAILQWHKYRSPRVSAGTIQDQQIFPREVGGDIVPTGAYKQMQAYGGMIDLLPRLEDAVGWLLLGALGHVVTTANEDRYGNAVTGVYTHRFQYRPHRSTYLPWMAARCLMPGDELAHDRGEVGQDVVIANMAVTIPQMGKVAARLGLQGRRTNYDNNPNDWGYVNSNFEASETVPDAGRGSFSIGGVERPAMGCSIVINNGMSSFQQEMVIGSFNPDTFIPLTRDVACQFQYKYENSDLAREVFTNLARGTEWSPLPHFVETAGSVFALDVTLEAPENIPGTTVPHRISFCGNKITVARDGYPDLTAGNLVVENYTITFLAPDDNDVPYVEIVLENGIPSYVWPGGGTNVDPVVGFATAATYTGTDLTLDVAATVVDADSPDFEDGRLHIYMEGDDFDEDLDMLQLTGVGASFSGTDVLVGVTTIGTANYVPGAGQGLAITLNINATPARLQTLLRNVQYATTDDTVRTGDEITIRGVLSDGDGGWDTLTMLVTH